VNQLRFPRPGFRLALTLAALLAAGLCHADDGWGAWPAGQEPAVVGTKVVQNLLGRDLPGRGGLTYQETCSGYGAVRFAEATNNQDLLSKVLARYQPIITDDGSYLLPTPNHVDRSVFGILPLEMYKVTKDQKYLTLGLSYADVQFATLNPAGLSSETRYYIDDAYKLCVMQMLAFRATQKADYAANAVKEMSAFIDQLQQPTGLFFHGPDAHVYWGRGNGWIASGLTEMLLYLPADNPARPKIMTAYKAMMAGLLKDQAPDGRWRQVLGDDKAWEENSCTGYFIFALGEGVDQGWLDAATYRPAVKKDWEALCGQLDANANVTDVSILTEHSNDESYYLSRPRDDTGNLHGQFACIWAATALLDQKPAAAASDQKAAATTATADQKK
jgi:unsaturated rhamnogalacturonyl hydrolase